MENFNLTLSDVPSFILAGIPGLEDAHVWISIPFSMCYIVVLLGNFMVLYVVGKDQTLQKPMYLLLCMLSLTDIITTTSVIPKTLCTFCFNLNVITLSGCLMQLLFLNVFSMMQSNIFLAMAFDRYVAICKPLMYTIILSNACIAKIGVVSFMRCVVFLLPLALLLIKLPFCGNRIIAHTHCLPIAVAKISCGDLTFLRMYGLVNSFVNIGLDLIFIALSYCLIVRDLLKISSKKAHQKALNTCTAHICLMLLYHIPNLFSVVTLRFGDRIAPYVQVLMANLYVLVPSMLNPIIYGVKTKELQDKVKKHILRM